MIQTITFREIAIHGNKNVKCAGGCGRRLERRRKFYQTLSPFNKTADGSLKTQSQIEQELIEDRRYWLRHPETCKHCRMLAQPNPPPED